MRAAGIGHYGDCVRPMTIPEPRGLEPDELLLQVRAAGVGNWDNIARTGGWDLGIAPPMALGVEAAGTVLAVGSSVQRASVGDSLITHPVPLRDTGTWVDYHDVDWPRTVRELTAQQGVAAAANAVRGQASMALQTIQPGGRLATVTSDPPPERDGITVSSVYVRADGEQLETVATLLERRQVRIRIGGVYGLEQAEQALSAVVGGRLRGAAVLEPQR